MELETFLQQLNKISNVEIDEEYLNKLFRATYSRLNDLEVYIKGKLKVDNYTEEIVKNILNLPNLNNKTLSDKLAETGEEIYERILETRKLKHKKQSLENIKKNIDDGNIKPIYTLNIENKINISKPALKSLEFEEIMRLTQFGNVQVFERIEVLKDFLLEYESVVRNKKLQSSYLIKGLTLYFNYEYISEHTILNKFRDSYFKREEVKKDNRNASASTLRQLFAKIGEGSESIVLDNYELFESIYNQYKDGISLTKQLIKEGILEEQYYGFPHPDWCLYEEGKLKALEEDREIKERYKRKLDRFVEELKIVKNDLCIEMLWYSMFMGWSKKLYNNNK